MKTKVCTKCGKRKMTSEYGKHVRGKNGLRAACRVCHTGVSNSYHRSENGKNWRERTRMRNRVFIYTTLKQSHCIDCGDKRWQVLEFDHVRGTKEIGICEMINRKCSLERIEKEIAKCEVRCANCHRLKTAVQFGWYKGIWDDMPDIPKLSPKPSMKGESHHKAILTEKKVQSIRKLYKRGNTTYKELAEKFRVSKATIQAIINGRLWKHI
jgi:hypothetical protein